MKLTLSSKWFLWLAILLVDLLFVVYLAIRLTLPPFLVRQIEGDMRRDAIVVREVFESEIRNGHPDAAEINRLSHDLAKKTGLRITVIGPGGAVIGESDKPESELKDIENHWQRPEVQEALRKDVGTAMRHSDTIGVDLLYVAVPIRNDDLVGIVRVAMPLVEIQHTTARVLHTVAVASILVGLAATPILYWLSRRVTRPILQMREVAGRMARGDFTEKAPVRASGEIGELAGALNDMSSQLAARIRELNEEKTDLGAILAGMTEGVLVVRPDGRIRLTNQALRSSFAISEDAFGKPVLEAFHNIPLQDLVNEVIQKGDVAARELTFLTPNERAYELSATRLRSPTDGLTGVIVVFHDITRMRQFENTRKEFVANVSHELRTPLSIIKGYVETLLDEQPPDESTARQFLQIIQRHSRRLEALIADLLSISALESQQARLTFEPISMHTAAQSVMDELSRQALERSVAVSLEISEQLPVVRADARRLHQVLFNLLDNAIKYTPAGGHVIIRATEKDEVIETAVADDGPGIPAEHLPHVFERFYRVDKARSRELGGTGLGLSIVKHIIQSHAGRVWAESQVEKGSTFYFTLPCA